MGELIPIEMIVTNYLPAAERMVVIDQGETRSVSNAWWLNREKERWERRGIKAWITKDTVDGVVRMRLEREVL